MAMPEMQKISQPDFEKIANTDIHRPGRRLIGHQKGAIKTGERLMQFNTQDQAVDRGGPASIGKGTMTSLLQFGSD
jgi:hypothetical protein